MLVVLETFCELQQLKRLRTMFYLEKERPQDQLAIMEDDQMSFSSVEHVSLPQEDKSEALVDVPALASPYGQMNRGNVTIQ